MENPLDILNGQLNNIKKKEENIITKKLLISVIPYPPGNIYIEYDKYTKFHIYSESGVTDIDEYYNNKEDILDLFRYRYIILSSTI